MHSDFMPISHYIVFVSIPIIDITECEDPYISRLEKRIILYGNTFLGVKYAGSGIGQYKDGLCRDVNFKAFTLEQAQLLKESMICKFGDLIRVP